MSRRSSSSSSSRGWLHWLCGGKKHHGAEQASVPDTDEKKNAQRAAELDQALLDFEKQDANTIITFLQILIQASVISTVYEFATTMPEVYMGESGEATVLLLKTVVLTVGLTAATKLLHHFDCNSYMLLVNAFTPVLLLRWRYWPWCMFLNVVYFVALQTGWLVGLSVIGVLNGDRTNVGLPLQTADIQWFISDNLAHAAWATVSACITWSICMGAPETFVDMETNVMRGFRTIMKMPGNHVLEETQPYVMQMVGAFVVNSLLFGYPLEPNQLIAARILNVSAVDVGEIIGYYLLGLFIALALALVYFGALWIKWYTVHPLMWSPLHHSAHKHNMIRLSAGRPTEVHTFLKS